MGNKCFKDNADENVIYGKNELDEDSFMNTPTNASMKYKGFKA